MEYLDGVSSSTLMPRYPVFGKVGLTMPKIQTIMV